MEPWSPGQPSHDTKQPLMQKDPIIFSHSNPRRIRDHERNITDEQIKSCAKKGGVIGINGVYWFLDKEKHDIEMFVQHLDYVVQIVGSEHVGIGLDFVFENDSLLITHNTNNEFWPDRQYKGRKMGYLPPESFPRIYEKLFKKNDMPTTPMQIFQHLNVHSHRRSTKKSQ